MTINRESYIPLYKQIAQDLQQKIEKNIFEPGQRLPSEHELTEEYQVSRLTVRKSIKLLLEEDLIIIQQGKGMYVKFPIIQTDIMNDVLDVQNFRGFYETLTGQGLNVKIKLVKYGEEKISKNIAEALECSMDTKIRTIYRIFYLKDMPIAFNITYLSPELVFTEEMIEEVEDKPLSTLLKTSKDNSQLGLEEIRCSIGVRPVSNEIANRLNVPNNHPLMTLSRVFYYKDASPLVAGLMYLNTDCYQFTIRSNSKDNNDKPTLEMLSIY
ncbi:MULTISPECIES: GntR family transcriptional regulator [Cytobacillus]|uniref:GntR family transcriptional regulator n=1 Tax=Cytobacillus stercorigallinarum TaxID=2762240 RepID=A0ABR8QL00_9BACI|nr:GntR family transcriptional regulator [Cytobacillus stercorigallinarum]MBD7936201.1 GntR family transcriptional regulator [Cytobacillus stercorigallinarum]